MRHTTFRFALDPTPVQQDILARYAGASRFAYNQCLRLVTDAIGKKRANPQERVPWSGFDLINAFNTWKCSEAAGRVFVVAPDGATSKQMTGLGWRREVCAQVFEEAAVDLGHALAAYAHAKNGRHKGRVGFPTRKHKGRCRDSFRLRNRTTASNRCLIRIGEAHSRSVTLPVIGQIRVHDNTRRLRRLLRPVDHIDPDSGQPFVAPRAKILFATISRRGDRWYVSLTVRAPDLHQRRHHLPRPAGDGGGFIGVDRGLVTFAVAATSHGVEVARWQAPKPLTRRIARLRRRSRALSRAKPRSRNRVKAARQLSREHARIANTRRSFLHEVSSQLAKTHSKLVLEDLAVANMVRNRHLARAIGDAGWGEFNRQLAYKQAWRRGELVVCDRWFPSTKTCSRCGLVKHHMTLVERSFRCDVCGLVMDRDRNAAINLAAWAEAASMAAAQASDRQAGGRVTNAPGGEGAGRHSGDGGTGPNEGGTDAPVLAGAEGTREGWRSSSSSGLFDAL